MNSTLSEDAMDAGNPGWHADPDGYHLIEKLGKGGMGVVYRAQDLKTGQFVAIKFALGNTVPRFLREYRQLASLEHPFIVKVYSLETLPPYMVMEYLSGQTLSAYRNGFPSKRLPLQIGIAFLSQLTEALTYLHERNILHRDLKPENLMVLGNQIKLMDFGLVRPAQVSGPLTQSGAFIGTAKYAAPEQFLDAATVTAQADLYAVGVMMYEMFTGECPFKGADTATLREQHLNMAPLPPAQIAPEIPDALNALILSLLEKNPRNRPVSAGAVQFTLNSLPTPDEMLPSDGNIQKGQIIHQRYRIDAPLGQGGYGTVYKADDLVLGQPVAIKVNTDVSAEAVRRFQEEASLLGRLQHTNLPRPRAYFAGAGAQCIVMDFVPGANLAEKLKAGPIAEADLLLWADQICAALTYLHSQTPPIIHRDIKPENIIISEDRTAWLVDFGIAKVAPAASAEEIALVGTPGYAPPEQYTSGQTDARSDIYALGATLYHALTGVRPPEKKLTKPATEINPKVSTRVSRAIARAMALKPNQRYASTAAFKDALHGHPRPWTQAQKAIGCALGLAATFGFLLAFLGIVAFGGMTFLSFVPTNTSTLALTPSRRAPIIRKTKTPKTIQISKQEKTSTAKNTPTQAKNTPAATSSPAITRTLTLRATAVPIQSTSSPVTVLPLMPSETFTRRPSFTPSNTSTITVTVLTKMPTTTPTVTMSRTMTVTATITLSRTVTMTPTATLSSTVTFTPSATFSKTPTGTWTITPSRTSSRTPTSTISTTPTPISDIIVMPDELNMGFTLPSTVSCPLNTNYNKVHYWNTTDSSGWAKWHPSIPISGYYNIYFYLIQDSKDDDGNSYLKSSIAKYYMNWATQIGGPLNQNLQSCIWYLLGRYYMKPDDYVYMPAFTGENSPTLIVDGAMKFVWAP